MINRMNNAENNNHPETLPEGWTAGELGDLCDLSRNILQPPFHGADEYVGLEHIDSGKLFLRRFGTPDEVRSTKNCFEPRFVLYGKLRPYLDKAAVAQTRGICSTDVLVLKPKREMPSLFVVSVLHSDAFIEHAKKTTHGVNHPRTSWKSIKEFSLAVPPVKERKKIAAVLLKLQQAILIQERTLDTLRELKKATLQRIFTQGLHGKSQSTDLGPIPEGWVVSSLGDLCDENGGGIQTGPFESQLHASDYEEDGTPIVNPTHMRDNEIVHEDIPRIGEHNVARLSRHKLETGDILFARRGEIGRHAFVNEGEAGWICGTGCFLVRMKTDRVSSEFTSWFLYGAMAQEWLVAHASGSIMPNLNTTILRACPIIFPERPAEQVRIAAIFQTLDKKIAVHERKRDTLNELFRTTLNQLMTAQIRVNNLNINTTEVEG